MTVVEPLGSYDTETYSDGSQVEGRPARGPPRSDSRPSSFSLTPSSQLTRGHCSPMPASRDLLGDASVHSRLQALRFQLGAGGRFRGSSQGRARSSLLPRAPASACGRPLQETTPTRLSSHPRRRSRRSSRHLRLSPTSRPMRSPHSRPQCAASPALLSPGKLSELRTSGWVGGRTPKPSSDLLSNAPRPTTSRTSRSVVRSRSRVASGRQRVSSSWRALSPTAEPRRPILSRQGRAPPRSGLASIQLDGAGEHDRTGQSGG